MASSREPIDPVGRPCAGPGVDLAEPAVSVHHVLSADPVAVRIALLQLTGELAAHGIAEPDASTAELVLAEVLNNIAEHAFAAERGGRIEFRCTAVRSRLLFEICDDGRAMPNDALPEGCLPEATDRLDSLPEGGFGWFLIRRLAQDLCYKRLDNGNWLRFAIALSDGPGQA
jgi:serine/threonine-protein kinase RsbW